MLANGIQKMEADRIARTDNGIPQEIFKTLDMLVRYGYERGIQTPTMYLLI
ncbi:hypothetical protein [Desulfuribacillus alkaliarsenatis]|uniref:hypothetical protein n=1 Tax=Desulfuribacillus alkaliarsenatis TaxID=766136 RepID=UPI00159F0E5C|nr:hypothetical protein [Desulfuribacillus alkaliarsenatis]